MAAVHQMSSDTSGMIRWFLLIPRRWLPDAVPGSEEGVGGRELAKLVVFMGLGFWRVWRGTDHRKEAASKWGHF